LDSYRPNGVGQKATILNDGSIKSDRFNKILKKITFKNVSGIPGALTLVSFSVSDRQFPVFDREIYIEKDELKVGADLLVGGTLTYLERTAYGGVSVDEVIDQNDNVYIGVNAKENAKEHLSSHVNLINIYDQGRQIQQSYYANVGGTSADTPEEMEKNGTFDLLPKKEVIGLKKEYEKLNKLLCGIRAMDKLPQAMIIVDPKKELNAIREARKLNIPIFGIVDTNCDPDDVDYVIPGNDDAVRAVKVVLGVLGNAIAEVQGGEIIDYVTEEDKKAKKEVKKEEKTEVVEEVAVEEVVETVEEVVEATEDLSAKTLTELKAMAKTAGIKGYSTMKKDELIASLSE
jgi:hypothetical protein